MLKKSLQRRSIVFSWLVSYFFILLIPVLISGVIYIKTADIIENEVNRANNILLQQVQQVIDMRIRELDKLSTLIEWNENLQLFLNIKGVMEASDRYSISKAVKDFKNYKNANVFINDFFVYLKNQQSIVTPTTYIDKTIIGEPAIRSEGVDYEALINLIKSRQEKSGTMEKNQKQVFLYPAAEKKSSMTRMIVYTKPVISAATYKTEGFLTILINESEFLQPVNNIKGINNSMVLVIDKNDNIISSMQPVDVSSSFKFADLNESIGTKSYILDHENITLSYISSEIMPWKYVSITPSRVFMEKASFVRRLTYASLLISMIAGAIVAFVFTKKNYNPVSKLVQTLAAASGVKLKKKCNEYSFIEDAVNVTIMNKRKVEELLHKQNNTLKSNFIIKLLKGKLDEDMPVDEILASYDMNFTGECFSVIIFYIEDYSGNISLDENESLIQFIIKNVVEELAGQKYKGYVVDIDDLMVCLVNVNNGDSDANNELSRITDEAEKFIEENFSIRLSASISRIHQGLPGIHDAFTEAMEIMNYRMLMGNGNIIQYNDISKHKLGGGNFYYPIDTEQQLINHIKSGEREKAQLILDEIYDKNFVNANLSLSLAKCLVFDLIATIIKTLDDINLFKDSMFLGELNTVDRIAGCKTVKDMKKEMQEILDRACSYIIQHQKSHNMQITENIIQYVKEHFKEEDLSVSQIADKFQMNLSYISKQFKKQNGDGLYDYINKIRVDMAKQLLMEGNDSIISIARQVGFYNDKSFIRVFKKYQGITPGRFKEINAGAKS